MRWLILKSFLDFFIINVKTLKVYQNLTSLQEISKVVTQRQ